MGDALRRLGGRDVNDPEVVTSPRELFYRNKMSFTLRRLPGNRVVAGLHELERPGRVLDIQGECRLPRESVGRLWTRLRQEWGPGARHLPGGGELRLTLRSEGDEGALVIQGGEGDGDAEYLLSRVDGLVSIWREDPRAGLRHLAGARALRVAWLDEGLELPGDAFLQVNPEAGQALHGFVLSRAREASPTRLVEGFCGFGTLGRTLAREGVEVVGIELDPLAVAEARRGAPPGFRALEGRVEDHLSGCGPVDLLLLNPPRIGLAPEIPGQVRGLQPRRIIYVSCDPATLARDVKRLGREFEVREIRSFDLFPQTAQVETVVVLGLNGPGELEDGPGA